MRNIIVLILLLYMSGFGLCLIEEIDLPLFLKNCLLMKSQNQSVMEAPSESVCNTCLTRYLWMAGPNLQKCDQKSGNITTDELTNFVGKMINQDNYGKRKKRQASTPLRKEYRALTDNERNRFHRAMNQARQDGYFGMVARFHNRQVKTAAHGGPNFFGYHRMLLLILEKVLQYYDPTVAVPYWNSALDSNLPDPRDSVIWTNKYFGTRNGRVNSGPFAGWGDLNGNTIMRSVGNGGSLFTEDEIRRIINMNSIQVLSEPSRYATLESMHDDVHNYIGGTMLPVELAPWDPVFWLHHCFVDYLWEVWRYNHRYDTTYPTYPSMPDHYPDQPMKGMPYMGFFGRIPTNRDGYTAHLARQSFYQLSPTCSPERPNCGSPDLQCNTYTYVCVSVDNVFRRQVDPYIEATRNRNVHINSNNRRWKRNAGYSDITIKSEDIDKVYIPRQTGACMGQPVQNTFIADCSSNVKNWAFIPIKVVHLRPNEVHYKTSDTESSYQRYDMYDEHKYRNLRRYIHPENSATYQDCQEDESGAFKVRIKSAGISYFGQYIDYVFVDNRLPVSSHIGYIGVAKPTNKVTEAFITASDGCGRLCKPTCARKEGDRIYYVSCSGAIRVTPQGPLMYGNDFGEAVLSMWEFRDHYTPYERQADIFMVFYCDYSNTWPWEDFYHYKR